MKALIVTFILVIANLVHVHAQEFGRTDTSLDVQHYSLSLHPDMQSATLNGECRVTFTASSLPEPAVVLDAVDMEILAVETQFGSPVFAYDSAKLRVAIPEAFLPGDTLAITIRYRTSPSRGMFFVVPNASFPKRAPQFYTHNQPDDARYWYPCHDVPWDKATFDVSIVADSNLYVVGNGEHVSVAANGNGDNTWQYRVSKPMSTYLAAVVGGRFARYTIENSDGVPLVGLAPPNTPNSIMESTYGATGTMLRFFERYNSTAYPWTKYVQVPLQQFPYGGMENTSLTFLSDAEVLLNDRAREDHTDQPLIAHELAHQWWGDLVTCYDWEHLWINEGFATYFQQLWTRESLGKDEFDYQRLQGIENVLRYLDGDDPLTMLAHRKNAPQNLYTKGAAILSMLSDIMGEKVFRAALYNILARYAHGSVTSEQLQKEFERESGKELGAFFHCWLSRNDYPILDIEKQWDRESQNVHVHVRQTSSSGSAEEPFYLPVRIEVLGTGAQMHVLKTMDTTWTLDAGSSSPFIDVQCMAPGRVHTHEPASLRIAKLKSSSSIVTRIRASEILADSLDRFDVRNALFNAGVDDPYYGVRFRIARALSDIDPDTVAYGRELIEYFIRCLGDTRASVRSTAINALSRSDDPQLAAYYQNMLDDPSHYVEAAALIALVRVDSTSRVSALRKRLGKPSYKNVLEKAAIEQAGRYGLEELVPEIRALAGPGHPLDVRFAAVKTLLGFASQRQQLLSLLTDMLQEPVMEVRYLAMSALAGGFPQDAAALFRMHLTQEQNDMLKEMIRRYLSGE